MGTCGCALMRRGKESTPTVECATHAAERHERNRQAQERPRPPSRTRDRRDDSADDDPAAVRRHPLRAGRARGASPFSAADALRRRGSLRHPGSSRGSLRERRGQARDHCRFREALLSKYVFEYHSAFRDTCLFKVDFMAGETRPRPTIEGGDLLVARGDLLVIGHTERTNAEAIKQLTKSLREVGSGVKTVIVVELPKQRSFMHLDTVFTFTSRDECLIYPPVILPGGSQAAKVTSMDLTRKSISHSSHKSLLGALKKFGLDLDPIYCGGKKAVDQQREQWTDGANAFTLAPGIVMLYERNVRTAEELSAHGYHILYEDDVLLGRTELETWKKKKYAIQIQGHELSRARGGPRCMTMPLERDDV